MPVQIPLVPSAARYRFGAALDGVQYLFDVRRNGREGVWHVTLLTEDGIELASSLPIVLGVTSLGWRSVDPRMPPGLLRVRDTSDNGEDAEFEDLGERVVLYYFSEDEL